eukprot:RCo013891
MTDTVASANAESGIADPVLNLLMESLSHSRSFEEPLPHSSEEVDDAVIVRLLQSCQKTHRMALFEELRRQYPHCARSLGRPERPSSALEGSFHGSYHASGSIRKQAASQEPTPVPEGRTSFRVEPRWSSVTRPRSAMARPPRANSASGGVSASASASRTPWESHLSTQAAAQALFRQPSPYRGSFRRKKTPTPPPPPPPPPGK